MKYRFSHWCFKLLAWLLAAGCLVFGFWSAYIGISCANFELYFSDKAYQQTYLCAQRVENAGHDIIAQYRADPDFQNWDNLLKHTDLRFIILEEKTGIVTASYVQGLNIKVPANLRNNRYLHEDNYVMELGEPGGIFEDVYVCDYYFGSDWSAEQSYAYMEEPIVVDGSVEGEIPEAETVYQILYLLPKTLHKEHTDVIGAWYEIYRMWDYWKDKAVVVFACSVIGFLIAVGFLLSQAGRRPGRQELAARWFDRIWLEVILAVGVCSAIAAVGLLIVLFEAYYNSYLTWPELQFMIFLCDAGAVGCGLLVVGCLVTLSVRLKMKTLLSSALCWKLLCVIWRWVKRPVCWVFNILRRGLCSIGIVPLAALTLCAVFFTEFLLVVWLVNSHGEGISVILIVLFQVFLFFAAIWCAAQMKQLQKAAKALAQGELEYHLDTKGMYWQFKQHGEDLNAIAGGMNKAVEQKMRSERLKTELITNVSHDIKTPLTSIVNYVDLLQKPHTEAEGKQYLEVLQRQSARLKKLTEDLVEAAKASTGNIPVDIKEVNVLELVTQAVEEYRERFENTDLQIITSLRADLIVLADGQLLWRVLDNLLGNVVKYAMPGTRVYLTAAKHNTSVSLSIKNISRQPLDMAEEELMERFVRGDLSRHTEGSGLGLNIARSLIVLQNGSFDLTVDGDLFKVQIRLPSL